MAIGAFLEELKLADAKQLAKELLARLRTSIDNRGGLENINAAIVTQILRLDPAVAREVVDLALSKQGQPEQGLPVIEAWAVNVPSLASVLTSGVLQVAEERAATGDYRQARTFVVVAERINPQCDTWHFWEKRFQDAKDKDPRGAAEILTFMVLGNHNPERLREATGLYQDLARAQPGHCAAASARNPGQDRQGPVRSTDRRCRASGEEWPV